MQVREAKTEDLDQVQDIDGIIESMRYLHLARSGEAPALNWALEERPLREKLIQPNRLDDETRFTARQILLGAEEGNVMVAEHEAAIVGLLVARPDPALQVMHMIDLRVDYDHRRQGVGMALIYLLMMTLKGKDIRAISTVTQTNNFPACQLLRKCGFELTGFDTHRRSNHDLVKEQVSLLWYAAFD